MKCSQMSCEKSLSTKNPVSKVRIPYPLETRVQNFHLSMYFSVSSVGLTAFLCLMEYYLAPDSALHSAPYLAQLSNM